MSNRNRLSPQDTAKILRKQLRAAFPGVKFSLRMSRGTAWGSYSLSWTGGPSVAEVDAIALPFEGKKFDGMTDSTSYVDRPVLIDENGEGWLSGIGYLSTYRQRADDEPEPEPATWCQLPAPDAPVDETIARMEAAGWL
jgi:hypothetical protein